MGIFQHFFIFSFLFIQIQSAPFKDFHSERTVPKILTTQLPSDNPEDIFETTPVPPDDGGGGLITIEILPTTDQPDLITVDVATDEKHPFQVFPIFSASKG